MTRPLVLLHGFTGSPESWGAVREHLPDDLPILAPALAGHDGTPGPAFVESFEDELDRLAALIAAAGLDRPRLAGYSLGGRVALGLIVRHPELFGSATLIGANPGLADPAEREARTAWDGEWIRLLEEEGLPTFVAAWEALPLFGTQDALPGGAMDRQRRIRLGHHPAGLARSLRVLGLAAMPDWGPRLGEIKIPVDLVVGEHDGKFRGLAAAMARQLPRARTIVVGGAGHNVVLERPAEIARLLQELHP